jgi:hypothetical protein
MSKKIKSIGLTRLLASASQTFHSTIAKILGEYEPIKTTLGVLLVQYNNNINAQQKAASKDLRLSNTDEVQGKDKARDGYFKMFVASVENFLRSPDAEEKANAKIISNIMTRFKGLDKYEMQKETGEIDNMITALRVREVFDAVLELGLDSALEKLDDANNDFRKAVNERYAGELKKNKNIASEQRKLTEATYLEIVEKLNAFAIAVPSEELDKCIDRLNIVIDDYARTIAHMRSGGSGNEKLPKKEEPENPTIEE